MSAIRLARGFTGRKYVIKFEGCYHGHADALLVKAGSGVATLGIPGSAGVPAETAHFTLALPYNDLAAVEAVFAARTGEIACVIVEPVVGNAGTIPPAPGYLEGLREITAREGALLIIDEVMTGFRLALGGAQEVYGITPDLTTLGKILGGGLPCGAFGGRAEMMDQLAPLGSGVPGGDAERESAGDGGGDRDGRASDRASGQRVSAAGEAERGGCGRRCRRGGEAGVAMTTNRVGAMWTWFFTGRPGDGFRHGCMSDTAAFGRFHRAMLEPGVWLPPSQYEAVFLGTAHTMEDIRQTVVAAREAFAAVLASA